MSIIKATKFFDTLPLEVSTNVSTGVIEIRSLSILGIQGDLLATGDAKGKWSYNDQAGFRRRYNNTQRTQGKPGLSQEKFTERFFTKGTKSLNKVRADVLNDETNYETYQLYEDNTNAYSTNGIPGVKNPKDGTINNSKGEIVADSDKNEEEEKVPGAKQGGNPSDSSSTLGGERDFGSNKKSFRYPIGILPDLDYDFIQFIACEYKAGGFTELTTGGNIEARVGPSAETITLPMIQSISESSRVGWGGKELNELQAGLARIAGGALDTQTGGLDVKAAADKLGSSTVEEANKLITDNPDLKAGLVAFFAGQAASAGAANILGRTNGSVLNPNLELLFTGPSLRSFKFSFKFRPRDPDEAKMIRSIIRVFKRNMAVQRKQGELFLFTPNIFKIKYLHKGGDHPFMNRLMPCACTAFNVVYTPDNNYMTYADGSMTGYDVDFTMAEIVPIYADHQKNAGGTGF
jgi:hypothetical protein